MADNTTPAPVEQPETAPAPEAPAPALPKTASLYPLIGLAGLFCWASAAFFAASKPRKLPRGSPMNRRSAIRTIAIVSAVSCFLSLTGNEALPRDVHDSQRRPAGVAGRSGQKHPRKIGHRLTERGIHGSRKRPAPNSHGFSNEDVPVTVGILVDESQSMTPSGGSARRGSRCSSRRAIQRMRFSCSISMTG